MVSDNGPQYSCGEFKEFTKQYGIQHTTSSPLHPQANRKAEKGVQIVQRLREKAIDSATLYHTATHCTAKKQTKKGMNEKNMKLKLKQKMYYETTARRLESLRESDVVRIEDPNSWNRKATVLKEVTPRSITIKTENGQVIRRNRKSLLKTQEDFEESVAETESAERVSSTPEPHTESAPPSHPVWRRSARSTMRLIEQ